MRHTIVVRAVWDPEADVWVATSGDIKGLVTEAKTQKELIEKLHVMIPELLEGADGFEPELSEIPVVIMSEQLERVRIRA